jgi:cell division protein FtsQ
MTIDPRLADRRREVAEDHANRNLRRLVGFLAGVIVVGAVVWLFLSPFMSVSRIRVAGALHSDTDSILSENDVSAGRPLILIRAGAVETALEVDPWVVSADVDIDWPNDIVVKVVERVPRAWVETAGGWWRRAEDGESVPGPGEPDNTLGWARFPTLTDAEAAESGLVLGAIEFISALPPEVARLTAVRLEAGELWAVVDGYQVRLGREIEMADKAVSLLTLLGEDIPRTSVLVLVAPTHPAVQPAGGGEDGSEGS